MKICEKCGAHNSDQRMFCVDCNEKLGDRLSELQELQFRQDTDVKIEKMYNKNDPLYVSRFDKTVGAISLMGAAVSLVFIIIKLIIGQSTGYLWLGIVLFLLAIVEAFIPKLSWELEKLRLSFYINGTDDLEPSDFYFIGRKISIIVLTLLGIALLAVGICSLLNINFI